MEAKFIQYKGMDGRYIVYPGGNIYSVLKKRFLRPYVRKRPFNYAHVLLRGTGDVWMPVYVHVVIADHFLTKPNYKVEVNHIDMNKENNHYTNLEWVTHSQNLIKARNKKAWVPNAKDYDRTPETRELMAKAKFKKVVAYTALDRIEFESIEDLIIHFKTYRQKFTRTVNSDKTINGYTIRYV